MKQWDDTKQQALESFAIGLCGNLHFDNPTMLGFHQVQMDSLGIPWSFQNMVAGLMERKENYPGYKNFRSLIRDNLIKIPFEDAFKWICWDDKDTGLLKECE